MKKRIVSTLVFLVVKTRKNIHLLCQKVISKEMLIHFWYEKKAKGTMFLSEIVVVIIYRFLVQQKFWKAMLVIALKFMVNKIRCWINEKYERKKKSLFVSYADFESILVLEDNGKQNPEKSYTNK